MECREKKDPVRKEVIQYSLAGVEVNLLIASLCMLAATAYYPLSLTLISAANMNVLLVGANLLPAYGLDGESALSALCGARSVTASAMDWMFPKERRRELLRQGAAGWICYIIFAVTLLSNILFLLLFIYSFVGPILSVFG